MHIIFESQTINITWYCYMCKRAWIHHVFKAFIITILYDCDSCIRYLMNFTWINTVTLSTIVETICMKTKDFNAIHKI